MQWLAVQIPQQISWSLPQCNQLGNNDLCQLWVHYVQLVLPLHFLAQKYQWRVQYQLWDKSHDNVPVCQQRAVHLLSDVPIWVNLCRARLRPIHRGNLVSFPTLLDCNQANLQELPAERHHSLSTQLRPDRSTWVSSYDANIVIDVLRIHQWPWGHKRHNFDSFVCGLASVLEFGIWLGTFGLAKRTSHDHLRGLHHRGQHLRDGAQRDHNWTSARLQFTKQDHQSTYGKWNILASLRVLHWRSWSLLWGVQKEWPIWATQRRSRQVRDHVSCPQKVQLNL